jgi:hypothetical protein
MTEEKFSIWALGFTMGVIVVIGAGKLMDRYGMPEPTNQEMIRAETLIEMYNRGKIDVLRLNPVSPELDAACLELWSRKQ